MDAGNRAAAIVIGRRVRRRREELGRSLEEVAEEAGVDVETVEMIEAGEIELDPESLVALTDTALSTVSWPKDDSGRRRRRLSDPPL